MQTEGTNPNPESVANLSYGRLTPRYAPAEDPLPEAPSEVSSAATKPKDISNEPSESADAGNWDQLPFADSVKILSEAMKARVKRQSGFTADDGAPGHKDSGPSDAKAANGTSNSARPAGQSLNELLDALKSAMDRAGLEKGNQNTLTRIISDIRNSIQYEPQGKGAVKSGPSPNLLDLSA